MLDIVKECQNAQKIGITGHANPDGDCVSSTLGMQQFLKKIFPEKEIEVLLEKPSDIFTVIEGYDQIIYMDDAKQIPQEMHDKVYDVMIVLDTVIDRCGLAIEWIESSKKVINIDHHVSNKGQGALTYVDSTAGACAQIVFEMIAQKPEYYEKMDQMLAKTIYIGIIHDSGVMQYSNTTPKLLEIVAKLIGFGFDFTKLIDETFYEKTYLQSQITARALLEAFPMLGGKCMVSYIDKKTMDFYGVDKKDLSGIVNQLRIIKGVEVGIFLYEIGPQQIKVSLRSGGMVDVSKVTAVFGGGGHVRAAGCSLNGSFHDVINMIMEQIALQLEN